MTAPGLDARIAYALGDVYRAAHAIRAVQRWRRAAARRQVTPRRYKAELATLGDRLGEYTLNLAALTDDLLQEAVS